LSVRIDVFSRADFSSPSASDIIAAATKVIEATTMSMRMAVQKLAIVGMLSALLTPPIVSAQGEKQQEVSSLDNFQSVLNVVIDVYIVYS